MADLNQPRVKRRRVAENPIKTVNNKDDQTFISHHLRPSSPSWTSWVHPKTSSSYSLSLKSAGNLSKTELQACFDLVEETSRADYEPSSIGWIPSRKKAEMKSPELKYILVKDGEANLCGFTSLMPTWEEGQPVVYCYEIHLKAELRGTGLAQQLIGYHEKVAANTSPIEKVMLTCFLSNKSALKFYGKLGFTKDDISPGPRTLRGGKIIEPDYVILSKEVARRSNTESNEPAS
ncbi:acyl-CoA N-acyltransferase [Microdochium trichocladiopsis]|uniref:N-alpha-acetyltransferase 40 n=1 Tax=Microdochium trichocladiopsis TaxID=1682393 RepID=A0A9P9BJS0_9PEZI|nr:acyl-CoA N-acyltransferase [Microdochium trichocladiopsis]KAH7018375.1 acyl-CoA N-acyltransferase [Microdochium trichocladiopsis]